MTDLPDELPVTVNKPQTLQALAKEQLGAFSDKHGPPSDHDLERRMRYLVGTGQIPDDILETMPEVSRHNEPQLSPQEYDCGCVTIIRVTDRDCRTWLGHGEKPFEMRLALPCTGAACALRSPGVVTISVAMRKILTQALLANRDDEARERCA